MRIEQEASKQMALEYQRKLEVAKKSLAELQEKGAPRDPNVDEQLEEVHEAELASLQQLLELEQARSARQAEMISKHKSDVPKVIQKEEDNPRLAELEFTNDKLQDENAALWSDLDRMNAEIRELRAGRQQK